MAEKLIGIITGTGLFEKLSEQLSELESHRLRTPFGRPSDKIITGKTAGRKIAFINRHGKGHKLSPSEVPYAANIFALKKLGVRTVIATGAVGSLRNKIAPGDLVLADQFIDKTFRRQSTFFEGFAAVHCEMSKPACRQLTEKLYAVSQKNNISTHPHGTYVCMEGPQFSTRAESIMHRAWGADVVGMTAMPEAKLAREAQMCYSLIALASDYDCWRPHKGAGDKQSLLKEITANLQTAAKNSLELITAVLQSKENLLFADCSCRNSLALAVWTSRDQISPTAKMRLKTLFDE